MKLKKKPVIVISLLGLIILVIGIIVLCINKVIFNSNKIEVFDATYKCVPGGVIFYEDDNNIYSFPCANSLRSVYVKFENDNKMLVVDALENEMITIDELVKADKKGNKIIKIQEK